jgi:acyl-coenzyme A synthetase/AMP-(fatty) acid ligase
MVYTATTFKYAFDYHDDDIYWCTADCGWITGHSYLTYGPLLNGATVVVFEGVPNYPDAGRCWEIVDKYKVTIFYTAPTAIRSLMRSGDEPVKRHSRKSLRVLGSVGEPINPSAWRQEAIHCIFLYLFCLSLQNVLLKLYLSACILHDEASYCQVIYMCFRCKHSQRSHF